MGRLPADRSLFRIVHNVMRSGRKSARENEHQEQNCTIEVKQNEMMLAGDRLLDALRLERELGKTRPGEGCEEVFERWKTCREAVEQLSRSYALAVARWRESVLQTAVEENRQWQSTPHQTERVPGT